MSENEPESVETIESTESIESMAPELLLVDDNAIQAATRHAILSRAGIRVLVAKQPMDALRMLERVEVGRSLRLVVTDHLMPGMNGPELVERLRERMPEMPVLVLSGMPGAESEYEHLRVCFRLKPFPPEELIRIAQSMMGDPILRTA